MAPDDDPKTTQQKGQLTCVQPQLTKPTILHGTDLDYEFSYGDEITVTPRNYSFTLRHGGKLENHYAIIGMAHVAGNYPLYYDAINEKGLGIAGLNFVGNATYKPVNPDSDKKQITQFELIPFILVPVLL